MTKVIPNFGLYGTAPLPGWSDLVHCERIPERASLYGWEIERHRHDSLLQIICASAGSGEIMINDNWWDIAPTCLVVVPANAVHAFRFSADCDGPVITAAQKPLETVASIIAPDLLPQLRSASVLYTDPDSRHMKALNPILQSIERESQTYVPGQTGAGCALMVALLVQIARIRSGTEQQRIDERSNESIWIDRFRTLLDAHCRERWQVEQYADTLGIASGHLRRLCGRVLGMSAIEAINARVIYEAQRELAYSTLSVKQIAMALGFNDEAYFGRFFKKNTGLRPSEFRLHARQQLAKI